MHFDEVLKAWFVQGFGNSGNYLNLYIDGFLLKIERIIFIFQEWAGTYYTLKIYIIFLLLFVS